MSQPSRSAPSDHLPADKALSTQPLSEKVKRLQLPEMQSAPAESNYPKWLPLGLAVFSAVMAIYWFNRAAELKTIRDEAKNKSVSTNVPKPEAENAVTPKSSKPAANDIVLESNGYFIPARKILVSPKVSGMLLESNLQEGQRVKKGDVLGVIESVEYESDVQRFTGVKRLAEERLLELERGNRAEEIDQVRAELAEAEAMLKKTESDYTRARDLLQQKSIPRAEFDDAFASFQAQKQRAERLTFALKLMEIGPREERKAQARAELQQAEAELAKAQWRLENCRIRAPISGTILSKSAEEGNIVNPIAMNGSFSLCEMADLADLEVDLKIQERDVARVFVGQKCKVRAIAYPDRSYEGVVDRLMPIADRSKGAVPIRVKVTVPSEEEGVFLKPEMGAMVTFFAGNPTP